MSKAVAGYGANASSQSLFEMIIDDVTALVALAGMVRAGVNLPESEGE
jgi:hypothetical protein